MVVPVRLSWALEGDGARTWTAVTSSTRGAVRLMDSAPGEKGDSVHYRENAEAASASPGHRRHRESTGRRVGPGRAVDRPARRVRDHRPAPAGAAPVPADVALLPGVVAGVARRRGPPPRPLPGRRARVVR